MRIPIQIAGDTGRILVLCSDGTIWRMEAGTDEWIQMKGPPIPPDALKLPTLYLQRSGGGLDLTKMRQKIEEVLAKEVTYGAKEYAYEFIRDLDAAMKFNGY